MNSTLPHGLLLALALAACTSATAPTPTVAEQPVHSLARLTHLQWENTVVDLLSLDGPTGLSDRFVPDPLVSTYDNDITGLSLNPTLAQQYQTAAEAAALRVVNEPELYSRIVAGESDRDAWIRAFGARAYRRALTAEEVTQHAALFDDGAAVFASGDVFSDGVRASIAGFLQSPHFLYRAGGSEGHLGAKLSYTLWNSMPDLTLDRANAQGFGPGQLESQVERMLDHPRAHEMLADFHGQWMHIENYDTIYRISSEVLTQDFESSLPAAMKREAYAFTDAVVYRGGTVADLLTSRTTFVDERLGVLYGVTGAEGVAPNAFTEVQLPADERIGMLGLSGFLASHAGRSEANPIRRGGFVNTALLCIDIPPPPSTATPLPTATDRTLRQRVEDHTTGCGGACHENLNPPGFALGGFDQVGALQTLDRGVAIDTTGLLKLDDGEVPISGPVQLATVLAVTRQVHRCYAKNLFAYLNQRAPTEADGAKIDTLADASLAGTPIRTLIADIVTDPAFRATISD